MSDRMIITTDEDGRTVLVIPPGTDVVTSTLPIVDERGSGGSNNESSGHGDNSSGGGENKE